MKQYLDLLKTIQEKGTYKPAAREGMPGTQSLFGYQFRHNLADGFPLLTTKKIFWKGVVVELLWFLRGDTNIKFLVDNGVNIWNEDAYNYYVKLMKKQHSPSHLIHSYERFMFFVTKGGDSPQLNNYTWGDCGFQYGRVWRKWEETIQLDKDGKPTTLYFIDQIRRLIKSLKETPESRRHLVTAIDPAHDQDLALYWCHAMFQFNCRPLTLEERIVWAERNNYERTGEEKDYKVVWDYDKIKGSRIDEFDVMKCMTQDGYPRYYLDCQLYQRSADVVLGVPFNIASYALLTEILAKICNMIPGEFIHTFGDVHIYDNHKEAVEEQLKRIPTELPSLSLSNDMDFDPTGDYFKELTVEDFQLENYNPQSKIKAKLSTGLKK